MLLLFFFFTAIASAAAADSARPTSARSHPGRLIEVGGARLFVETEGKGPALILLPAGPGLDHGYFHPYLTALSPYATVVYFDPRGCGRSDPRPPAEYRLDLMVSDIEGVRRALGLGTINLMAHGLGQAVATLYADRHPESVGRLIFLGGSRRASSFLDAPGVVRAMTPDMQAAIASADADRYLSEDGRMRERLRILAPLFFHRLTDRSFQKAFVDQATTSAGVREAMADGLGSSGGSADIAAALGRLREPVLIVAGRFDPSSSVEDGQSLRDSIHGARLAILEESGAFPFAEEPVEFLKIVKAFLLEGSAKEGGAGAGGGI